MLGGTAAREKGDRWKNKEKVMKTVWGEANRIRPQPPLAGMMQTFEMVSVCK